MGDAGVDASRACGPGARRRWRRQRRRLGAARRRVGPAIAWRGAPPLLLRLAWLCGVVRCGSARAPQCLVELQEGKHAAAASWRCDPTACRQPPAEPCMLAGRGSMS